jgi:MoaA/NifB/PqqE/SkfB family radical SAM enzyme
MHVITQSWTKSRSGFARYIGCLAGHYQFHISAGGDFRPCDFTPLSIGNVRQESVASLWKKLTIHPAYRKHRQDCRMQCPSFREEYIDEPAVMALFFS